MNFPIFSSSEHLQTYILEFTFMILLCFLFVERNDGTEMH